MNKLCLFPYPISGFMHVPRNLRDDRQLESLFKGGKPSLQHRGHPFRLAINNSVVLYLHKLNFSIGLLRLLHVLLFSYS